MSNISQEKFEVIEEQTMEYRRFNTRGKQWMVLLNPPNSSDSITHFVASVNELFDQLLQNVDDGDVVGITIHNEVNLNVLVSEGSIRFR